MSFHFLNGNVYLSAFADTGPGTITVDPFADIIVNGADALSLSGAPRREVGLCA